MTNICKNMSEGWAETSSKFYVLCERSTLILHGVFHVLTRSWLMSARNRLCFLYRSSFNGSCQYWAWTRLKEKNPTKTGHSVSAAGDDVRCTTALPLRQRLTVSGPCLCTRRCSELYGWCHRCGSFPQDSEGDRRLLRKKRRRTGKRQEEEKGEDNQ